MCNMIYMNKGSRFGVLNRGRDRDVRFRYRARLEEMRPVTALLTRRITLVRFGLL